MSTSSDRGNARINKNEIENLVENTEEAITDSPTATGSYGPYRQERRKGHQVISTATYYQVERRGGAHYGETQDWSDLDSESDGASYSGGNF